MAHPADVLNRLADPRIAAHLLSKLKHAHNTGRAALAAELGKIGLTTPQFLALAAIEHGDEISSAELARRSFVTPQAMIAIVARMEAAGLITRAPAAGGGRSLTLRLTSKGAHMLSEARAHAYAIERYLFELLGPDAFETLLNALDRITDALSQAATFTKTTPWDAYVDAALPEPPRAHKPKSRAKKR
jgi:DNA-binding MarR family transcriptional regulator